MPDNFIKCEQFWLCLLKGKLLFASKIPWPIHAPSLLCINQNIWSYGSHLTKDGFIWVMWEWFGRIPRAKYTFQEVVLYLIVCFLPWCSYLQNTTKPLPAKLVCKIWWEDLHIYIRWMPGIKRRHSRQPLCQQIPLCDVLPLGICEMIGFALSFGVKALKKNCLVIYNMSMVWGGTTAYMPLHCLLPTYLIVPCSLLTWPQSTIDTCSIMMVQVFLFTSGVPVR